MKQYEEEPGVTADSFTLGQLGDIFQRQQIPLDGRLVLAAASAQRDLLEEQLRCSIDRQREHEAELLERLAQLSAAMHVFNSDMTCIIGSRLSDRGASIIGKLFRLRGSEL